MAVCNCSIGSDSGNELAPVTQLYIAQEGCRLSKMTHPFFTIGHSTRSTSVFVDLLRAAEVQLVVDVRTVPWSRANPQFNRDTLPITLSEFAIDYEHISALGGLRARRSVEENVTDLALSFGASSQALRRRIEPRASRASIRISL